MVRAGRDTQVSENFLLNLSKALKLDDAECCHLFLLAHGRPPPPEAYQWPSVSPLIQRLLDDLTERPAYVINLRWDVVAWNMAADSLFDFSGLQPSGPQHHASGVFQSRSAPTPAGMARGRAEASRTVPPRCGDRARRLGHAVADRCVEEPVTGFRRWFEQRRMESYSRGIGSILDPGGKRLEFNHMLTVDEHRHLRMVVYF